MATHLYTKAEKNLIWYFEKCRRCIPRNYLIFLDLWIVGLVGLLDVLDGVRYSISCMRALLPLRGQMLPLINMQICKSHVCSPPSSPAIRTDSLALLFLRYVCVCARARVRAFVFLHTFVGTRHITPACNGRRCALTLTHITKQMHCSFNSS